jgi:hypothetical protein
MREPGHNIDAAQGRPHSVRTNRDARSRELAGGQGVTVPGLNRGMGSRRSSLGPAQADRLAFNLLPDPPQMFTPPDHALLLDTPPQVHAYLEQLVATGLYGYRVEDAAERLICRSIESLIAAGFLMPAHKLGENQR